MKLKKSYTFQEIKEKLVKYCAYQDRCHQEVEHKMKEFLLIPEARDELLLYLIQERFLDEERFTRSYIRGKFYMKAWGKNKIKNRLRLKNINDKLIARCMDEISEVDYQQQIHHFLNQKLTQNKSLTSYEQRGKAINYLVQKGYEYEEINKMLRKLEEEQT